MALPTKVSGGESRPQALVPKAPRRLPGWPNWGAPALAAAAHGGTGRSQLLPQAEWLGEHVVACVPYTMHLLSRIEVEDGRTKKSGSALGWIPEEMTEVGLPLEKQRC